ncbi:hypothetical protein F4604DRAFT_1799609 [Suillus subluteus]|nr:hypothetical protein F4604DRAFT_1799609 [Suillus subluteus]
MSLPETLYVSLCCLSRPFTCIWIVPNTLVKKNSPDLQHSCDYTMHLAEPSQLYSSRTLMTLLCHIVILSVGLLVMHTSPTKEQCGNTNLSLQGNTISYSQTA